MKLEGQTTTRRKLAIATWCAPNEGNIYGKLTLNVEGTLKYIDEIREKTGEKITVTHIVGKALGNALRDTPDMNGRIFLGRYIPHKTVDIAFLVAFEGGKDLGKVKVENIDQKSVIEVARELAAKATRLRKREDHVFEKSQPLLKYLPTWLIRPILKLSGYLTSSVGVALPALGLEKYPFGACVITSVGMLDIDEGYAPPIPFARIPALIAVMRVKDRPVVENGQIVIRKQLDLNATLDHRFLDGFQGAKIAARIRKNVENPWIMDSQICEVHPVCEARFAANET